MGVIIFRTEISWYWLTALLIVLLLFFFHFRLLFYARHVRAYILNSGL